MRSKGWSHPLLEKEWFGEFGGSYTPDLLNPPLEEIKEALQVLLHQETFLNDLADSLAHFAGRPTMITSCPKLANLYGAKEILLKREDMLHGGAHKITNVLGQALIAKYLGKTELIAETGAGQHGVATSMVGARLGLKVKVFQGAKDVERQRLNAARMKMLGAELIPVESGSKTLKDAVSETFRYWTSHYQDSFYVIGSAVGPAPYPQMVAHFQGVISKECIGQISDPDVVIACVGGGSNAIGGFLHYIDRKVKLLGAEPAGGASTKKGRVGIFQGMKTSFLQDSNGQIIESHSISAGLDYPAVSPLHSFLSQKDRALYLPISDQEALSAAKEMCTNEGILPALETAHAVAAAKKYAKEYPDARILLIQSGRGDKDMDTYMEHIQ